VADDPKSERLGVGGTFAIYDSALRLLGGANATGALAAGVAFHGFDGKADIQESLKTIAVLFLLGVLMFAVAYVCWFTTRFYIDLALRKAGEEAAPEDVWLPRVRTFEQNRRDARIGFLAMTITGVTSFVLFMCGLAQVLLLGLKV
jgi:hypothetical protein